jgi:uncharacterized protein DUF5677
VESDSVAISLRGKTEGVVMPFEQDGFLAPEMSEWIRQHCTDHRLHFDVAHQFNRRAHEIVKAFRVRENYGQQLVCTALYLRGLDYFQGVVLMAERGMVNDAKVLHRTQLEATFACCAVAKDESVMMQFLAGDVHAKKKALSKLKRNAEGGVAALSEAELAEVEKELAACQQEIKVDRPLETTAEWLAQKAGMHDWYLSAYAYLSGAVHSGPRDVEQYLDIEADGTLRGFLWGPNDALIPKVLVTSCETLSFAMRAAEQVYDLAGHGELYETLARIGQGLK